MSRTDFISLKEFGSRLAVSSLNYSVLRYRTGLLQLLLTAPAVIWGSLWQLLCSEEKSAACPVGSWAGHHLATPISGGNRKMGRKTQSKPHSSHLESSENLESTPWGYKKPGMFCASFQREAKDHFFSLVIWINCVTPIWNILLFSAGFVVSCSLQHTEIKSFLTTRASLLHIILWQ